MLWPRWGYTRPATPRPSTAGHGGQLQPFPAGKLHNVSDQVTGTWTDPKLSVQTFATLAERWIQTKVTRAPKTVAGYRSLLDVVVSPRWGGVPLRDIDFADMQEWVTGLSVNGSTRFQSLSTATGICSPTI